MLSLVKNEQDLKTPRLPPEVALSVLRAQRGSGETLEFLSTGLSMAPLISEDSVVEITFEDPAGFRPGDLILFARGDSLVLHRLIHRWSTERVIRFREKGDRQLAAAELQIEDVLGRVTAVQRGDGRVVLRDPTQKAVAFFLLTWSRMEWRLYEAKKKLFGSGPTRLGRVWSIFSGGVRRVAMRTGRH